MKHLTLILAASSLVGCSNSSTPVTASSDTPSRDSLTADADTGSQPSAEPTPIKTDLVTSVAGPELLKRFYQTPFSWTSGPIDWAGLTPQERSRAIIGGGLVRATYNDATVRVLESYYSSGKLKLRAQELFQNGQWIRNGPEFFYQDNGDFELLFRLNGEVDGPVVTFNAAGIEQAREAWKDGVPVQ